MTAPAWRSSREFLAGVISHLPRSGRIAIITVPAPLARPAALLEIVGERPGFLWQTPFGRAVSGVGEVLRFTGWGENRLPEVQSAAGEAAGRILRLDHPDMPSLPPRFLGGLAFDPEAPRDTAWEEFPDAFFFLPRWSYECDGGRAVLRLAIDGPATRKTAEYLDEFDRMVTALELDRDPPLLETGDTVFAEPDIDAWRTYVTRTRDAIREGRFQKVVAARASVVDAERDMDPFALVARVAGEHVGSTVFALGMTPRGATFLGASPETLVSLAGMRVASDPLAGSIALPDSPHPAAGRDERGTALLASRKDAGEHALVVDAVTRALAPFMTRLDVPDTPRIRADRHVLHLHTPVRGELDAPRHVLDLLDVLHPTPSVGGVPTGAALQWIRAHEPGTRGWYAGPVGWFDTSGDGEFTIAIRSGLVHRRTARVYAGAGIVADSDPAAEYEETVVKQRPFLKALGVSTAVAS